jgi:hypothetical protein
MPSPGTRYPPAQPRRSWAAGATQVCTTLWSFRARRVQCAAAAAAAEAEAPRQQPQRRRWQRQRRQRGRGRGRGHPAPARQEQQEQEQEEQQVGVGVGVSAAFAPDTAPPTQSPATCTAWALVYGAPRMTCSALPVCHCNLCLSVHLAAVIDSDMEAGPLQLSTGPGTIWTYWNRRGQ